MANNRASCGSYLSDEELVIIRLGLPSTASTPTTNNNIGFVYSQFFNIFEFCTVSTSLRDATLIRVSPGQVSPNSINEWWPKNFYFGKVRRLQKNVSYFFVGKEFY